MRMILKGLGIFSALALIYAGGIITPRLLTESNSKNITVADEALIRDKAIQELNSIRGIDNNPAGVFVYADDYNRRDVFLNLRDTEIAPINISNDVGYQKALSYHKYDLCYVENTLDLDKTSELYRLLKEIGYAEPESKYVSCPIFHDMILKGYVSMVYDEGDFKGLTPVIISKIRFIATDIEYQLSHFTI